jgi:transcription elongation factor GreA-like protein
VPELACAWKVHGLFEFWNRRSTAWEMKDLYDIYLLINQFQFNDSIFAKALQQAFEDRKTPMTVYKRVLEGVFGQSKGTEKAWAKFVAKRDNRLLVENHYVLLEKVRAFLDKFFIPFCDSKFRI